jgi:hypothetical protein
MVLANLGKPKKERIAWAELFRRFKAKRSGYPGIVFGVQPLENPFGGSNAPARALRRVYWGVSFAPMTWQALLSPHKTILSLQPTNE